MNLDIKRTYKFEPDWANYYESNVECPKCGELLFIKKDSFIEMARCRNCNFEGAKDPVIKSVRILINKIRY